MKIHITLALAGLLGISHLHAASPTTPGLRKAKTTVQKTKSSTLVWCTYYGKKAHGRKTASGERHDAYGYHCAHLTLPFGTRIHLRNPKNGKECTVKVNDRGPHSQKYKLDLSWAAARDLGFLSAGVAQIEMTILD